MSRVSCLQALLGRRSSPEFRTCLIIWKSTNKVPFRSRCACLSCLSPQAQGNGVSRHLLSYAETWNVSTMALNLHRNLENVLSPDIQGFAKVPTPGLSSISIHWFPSSSPLNLLQILTHGINCLKDCYWKLNNQVTFGKRSQKSTFRLPSPHYMFSTVCVTKHALVWTVTQHSSYPSSSSPAFLPAVRHVPRDHDKTKLISPHFTIY